MNYNAGSFDLIVIGAGHAGCEAALAGARMGCKTLLLTLTMDAVAFMPCNPSIGGTSKGHLVREIDALGGQMGICTDETYIQVRMLNTSKGPAVHSLRAQTDKLAYQLNMRKVLENTKSLTLKQDEAAEILSQNEKIAGVRCVSGAVYDANAVVVATGVYLKSRIITGEFTRDCGPSGYINAQYLSESLKALGIPLQRFKTGTPARVDGRTLDYSKMEPQYGDTEMHRFSFISPEINREQYPCYLTHTNPKTHKIILDNLHRSPMYSGAIKGTGTRYCPSIEDKVVRFADKSRHQIFIEPEGLYTNEMYVQGMSSSLPADVQADMLHSMAGLENANIVRMGYAIEYDCIDPLALTPALAVKHLQGLYCAGQLNGSSGYEEAAAQGLLAGINAALYLQDKPAFLLDRSESYIGVLVDDLTIKGTKEPYRMMTSRAEFRLNLRQDNADMRLTEKGFEIGLATQERLDIYLAKKERILNTEQILMKTKPNMDTLRRIFVELNENPPEQPLSCAELLKRQSISYKLLCGFVPELPALSPDEAATLETDIKYAGYLRRQKTQISQMQRLEKRLLPDTMDYHAIKGLRIEARQKLSKILPASIGQASRISGVSPADIAVLVVFLEKGGAKNE